MHLQRTKRCLDWSLFYPFVCPPTLDQLLKWLRARVEGGTRVMGYWEFARGDGWEDEEEGGGGRDGGAAEREGEVEGGREEGGQRFNFPLSKFSKPLSPLEILVATLPPHGAKILPRELRKTFRGLFGEEFYELGVTDATPNTLVGQVVRALEEVLDQWEEPEGEGEEEGTDLLYRRYAYSPVPFRPCPSLRLYPRLLLNPPFFFTSFLF
jgi:hypothetical protein